VDILVGKEGGKNEEIINSNMCVGTHGDEHNKFCSGCAASSEKKGFVFALPG
jgi:hypothetical protein